MPEKSRPIQEFATGDHKSPRDRIRWFTVRNMSSETMPGFAIAYQDILQGEQFISQEKRDGQVVILLKKPDINAAGMANPGVMWANGPTPIPPGEYGKGHQDWPAQILHNGGENKLPNGHTCGPRDDSWYIWSSGLGFTCQSHDATRAIRGDENAIHTVWLSPFLAAGTTAHGAVTGGGTVQAGDAVPVSTALGTDIPKGIGRIDKGYQALNDGTWLVMVSGTVSSTAAEEGDILSITVKIGKAVDGKLTSNGAETYLTGHRIQTIDTEGSDENPFYGGAAIFTAENIAFSGPITLKKDEALLVENTSGSSIILGDFIFTVVSLGQEPRDPTGSLVYPND